MKYRPSPAPIVQVPHTICDHQAQLHTLELINTTLLLDGCPATITIDGASLHLTTKQGSCDVSAHAFWYCFAGVEVEPTAADAGRLLADSVMRAHLFEHMQQVQTAFQQIYEQSQQTGELPLPVYRLTPFAQQVLDAYDGTPETTLLLAKVLKQPPAIVTSWARSLGKEPLSPASVSQEAQTMSSLLPASAHDPMTGPLDAANELEGVKTHQQEEPTGHPSLMEPPVRLRWTSEMDEQLTEAFTTSQAASIKETIAEIAKRFNWTTSAVSGRVYALKLNEMKRSGSRAHEQEEESAQEDD